VIDPEEVERVVRDYVELPMRSEHRPEFLVGRFEKYSRLLGQARHRARVVSERVELVRVGVESVTEVAARVSLEATTQVEIEPLAGDGERESVSIEWRGPVDLVRSGGGWRIVNVTTDGRAALDSIVLLDDAVVEEQGVTVALRALDFEARFTRAVFECWNGRADGVELEAATLLPPLRVARRWQVRGFVAETSIASGGRIVTLVAWQFGFSLSPGRVRLGVRARGATLPDHLEFWFDLTIPSLRARRRADAELLDR
jgi:hypothetical protein